MFTTKPESGEKITKLGVGAGDAKTPFTEAQLGGGAGDAKSPFTERPATYASKSLGPRWSRQLSART